MKLKDNLRFLRKKEGYTQAELARKMHIKQYNISDYEIGRIEPSLATLSKFADIFDVSVDFLIGRKARDYEETEQDIESYITDMQIDKYLIHIYEDIKDLPEKDKQVISETVRFMVDNVIHKKD